MLLLSHFQSFAHFINCFFSLQLVYFSNFSSFLVSKQKLISVSYCLKSFHMNSISICSKVPTPALFQCLTAGDISHSPLVQNYHFSFCFANEINYSFPAVHLMHVYFLFQTFSNCISTVFFWLNPYIRYLPSPAFTVTSKNHLLFENLTIFYYCCEGILLYLILLHCLMTFLSEPSDWSKDYSAELFLSMKMLINFSTVWFSKHLYLNIRNKNDLYKIKEQTGELLGSCM